MIKNENVEKFINNLDEYKEELIYLRSILRDFDLTEEFKWYQPIYDYNGKNVLAIGVLKNNAILSFFKGSLLQDQFKILHLPGPNTQSGKLFKFKNLEQIKDQEDVIRSYIAEAIEIERQGLKIEYKDYPLPEELIEFLDNNSHVKNAWDKLTPGRKKGYALHFSQPKKPETRMARIEKAVDLILEGKGYNEGYKC